MQNAIAEEQAGLHKKKMAVEKAADHKVLVMAAIAGMQRMVPRPSRQIFQQHDQYLQEANETLKRFQAAGEDVEAAMRRATESQLGL